LPDAPPGVAVLAFGYNSAARMDDLKILLIEDDETVRALIKRAFTRSGAEVVEAEDGAAGMRAIYADKPDAVLLDIEMPGIDGFGALERIRDLTDVPVMMLTSSDDKDVKLRAFEGGADDYVTKPFDMEELVARTRALVRRRGGGKAATQSGDRYVDEHLEVDFAGIEARVGGEKLDLTPLQFRLLSTFVRHPNQALTPDQLLDRAWRTDSYSPERVKVHVANLRKKLADAGAPPDRIETVRGFGYRYRRAK
jgi:DNA-binding response OmpR family regulator